MATSKPAIIFCIVVLANCGGVSLDQARDLRGTGMLSLVASRRPATHRR